MRPTNAPVEPDSAQCYKEVHEMQAERDISFLGHIISLLVDSWTQDPGMRHTFDLKVEGKGLIEWAIRLRAEKQRSRSANVNEELGALITRCRVFWRKTGELQANSRDLERGRDDRIGTIPVVNPGRQGGVL